jgi:hypothetical protein
VFTISFLSKYAETWGIFPKTIYVFTSSQTLFILVVKKRKENTDFGGGEKKSSVIHREFFCWENAPKVARFRGKKEFRVHYIQTIGSTKNITRF